MILCGYHSNKKATSKMSVPPKQPPHHKDSITTQEFDGAEIKGPCIIVNFPESEYKGLSNDKGAENLTKRLKIDSIELEKSRTYEINNKMYIVHKVGGSKASRKFKVDYPDGSSHQHESERTALVNMVKFHIKKK